MTIPLPDPYVGGPIADADPRETLTERFAGTQRNFEAIARLLLDTGNRSVGIRWGTGSAVFTASADSAEVTIAHGLGKTPVLVLAMPQQPVTGRVHIQETTAPDATNIKVKGFQSAGTAVSITQTFYWLVLG